MAKLMIHEGSIPYDAPPLKENQCAEHVLAHSYSSIARYPCRQEKNPTCRWIEESTASQHRPPLGMSAQIRYWYSK